MAENLTPLTDSEARQTRYLLGEKVMRVAAQGLAVPARVLKDGVIYMQDGTIRNAAGELPRFENQQTNLIELSTAAAIRLEKEVLDAINAGIDPEDFTFTVTADDLVKREDALVHGRFAKYRPTIFAEFEHYNQPIIGLDVDAEGSPIPITALRRLVQSTARTAPIGFTASTGGAFEDLPDAPPPPADGDAPDDEDEDQS
jgi:hypothetical protein